MTEGHQASRVVRPTSCLHGEFGWVDCQAMEGRVVSVRRKIRRQEMEEATCLELSPSGIEGDYHYGHPTRQVLLLDQRTLSEFGYQPGELREQILLDFENLQTLKPGTQLQVGTSTLQITFDCAPCKTMAGYVGEEADSFISKMTGRRGMLARVVGPGTVKPGDVARVTWNGGE